MVSWFVMILLIVVILLCILVIRLSEVSTRLHTLESAVVRISEDNARIATSQIESVTHDQLEIIMRHFH
jgi:hypothetical protein